MLLRAWWILDKHDRLSVRFPDNATCGAKVLIPNSVRRWQASRTYANCAAAVSRRPGAKGAVSAWPIEEPLHSMFMGRSKNAGDKSDELTD